MDKLLDYCKWSYIQINLYTGSQIRGVSTVLRHYVHSVP